MSHYKIVNLSGYRLREEEMASIYTKYRWPTDAELFSRGYRFEKEPGLKYGYVELLEKYNLKPELLTANDLVIVPNIGNAVQAARDLLSKDVKFIINIADVSPIKRQNETDTRKRQPVPQFGRFPPAVTTPRNSHGYRSVIHP